MTIFRDEGRFPPSSSTGFAVFWGKVLRRRRLRPDPPISLQMIGSSLRTVLTLGIASRWLVSLHVYLLVDLKSLELVGRGSGMQAQNLNWF